MARILLLLVILPLHSFSQVILNGDFENNSASGDLINLDNATFNTYMPDTYSFGTYGDLDIITSTTYCSTASQSGDWFLAFTGGGTDMLSLTINQALTEGYSYTISFNDRFCNYGSYINHRFVFGLSDVQDDFGYTIYTASLPTENVWTEKQFVFEAPFSGQYLTIKVDSGTEYSTWELIDNVKFAGKPTGLPQSSFDALGLYPNPTNGLIAVAGDLLYHQIKIYNAIGQLAAEHSNETKTINLSSFSSGIYTFEFLDKENQVMARRKVVKGN